MAYSAKRYFSPADAKPHSDTEKRLQYWAQVVQRDLVSRRRY